MTRRIDKPDIGEVGAAIPDEIGERTYVGGRRNAVTNAAGLPTHADRRRSRARTKRTGTETGPLAMGETTPRGQEDARNVAFEVGEVLLLASWAMSPP